MTRVCQICGASYETCYVCEKTRSWRTLTDTQEHYRVLLALMDYRSGSKTADETLDALLRMNVELDDLSGYTQSTAKLLQEIIGDKEERERRTNDFQTWRASFSSDDKE